jgi:tetratricopeptide (TPR) repeat protein
MTTQTQRPIQGSSLDEALGQTEIGALIKKFKIPFAILLVLTFVGVVGYGFYGHKTSQKNDELSNLIFQFTESKLVALKEKTLDPNAFMNELRSLSDKTGGYEGIVPVLFSASSELNNLGQHNQAVEVLSIAKEKLKTINPYMQQILSAHLVVGLENLGENQKAIDILEVTVKSPLDILKAKAYLDLGRLYFKVGNNEKAKSNLQYVVDNYSDNEMAKLADIYLAKL